MGSYSNRYTRKHTPNPMIKCPLCQHTLMRHITASDNYIYECGNRDCEMIDAKYNKRVGLYQTHMEARADPENLQPDSVITNLQYHEYPPKPCPGCGQLVEMGRSGTVRLHARYECTNPKCRVSRFGGDRGTSWKTIQWWKYTPSGWVRRPYSRYGKRK